MNTTITFQDEDGQMAQIELRTETGQPYQRELTSADAGSQAAILAQSYMGIPDGIISSEPLPPTAPEPSPEGGIDPADVTVLVNLALPESMAMAQAYCAAHKVPTSNIIAADLGIQDVLLQEAQLTAARNAVEQAGRQFTVCAFPKPFAYREVPTDGNRAMSITSALSFGPRNVYDLTQSPATTTPSLKPRDDFGFAPAFLLYSDRYIHTQTGQDGSSILLLAKDAPSQGNPRGSARAGQSAKDLIVWDSRNNPGIGGGENACNNISSSCHIAGRTPVPPVMAYYGSMFLLGNDTGVNWVRGFYGDHVTSFGGFIDAMSPNSKGQTSLLWHMDRGACMSVGSVAEPWQGGNGSLAQQFVNVSVFDPLFRSGAPVGVAVVASVRCPDRMLYVGDPMARPCLDSSGTIPDPEPIPGVIERYENFANTDPNSSYEVNWKGVKRFRFINLKILSAPNYQRIGYRDDADRNRGLRIDNTGRWKWDTAAMPTASPATFQAGVVYGTAEIALSAPSDMKYFLAFPGTGSALQFECDLLEVLSE